MSDGSDITAGLLAGAVVAVGNIATLLRGHFAVRRELRDQRRCIDAICRHFGIEIASGPHVIEKDHAP